MLRKVFRTENSVVVSLPREAPEFLVFRKGRKWLLTWIEKTAR
jgi:hypothetical protein